MININSHLTCKHAEVCLVCVKSEASHNVNSVTEKHKIKVPQRRPSQREKTAFSHDLKLVLFQPSSNTGKYIRKTQEFIKVKLA